MSEADSKVPGDRCKVSRDCCGKLGLSGALASVALAAALAPLWPAFALDTAMQQDLPLTPPLPPPRPASRDRTLPATSLPPAAAIPAEPAPPQEAPRQPRSLPAAPRARMHACGLEWQKMKETGAAADKTWFEFAQVCLLK